MIASTPNKQWEIWQERRPLNWTKQPSRHCPYLSFRTLGAPLRAFAPIGILFMPAYYTPRASQLTLVRTNDGAVRWAVYVKRGLQFPSPAWLYSGEYISTAQRHCQKGKPPHLACASGKQKQQPDLINSWQIALRLDAHSQYSIDTNGSC